MFVKTTTFTLSCLLLTLPAGADTVLAEIDDLAPGEVALAGFELDRARDVTIEGRSLELRWGGDKKASMTAGWILAADTRELVWEMDGTSTRDRDALREHRATVRLEAGIYEVYYATMPEPYHRHGYERWWQSAGKSIARMLGLGDDEASYEEAIGDLGLRVRGDGRRLQAKALEARRAGLREEALLSLEAREAGAVLERGFELDRPLEIDVYAVGEITGKTGWDYGWIVDAESRERVWTFSYAESEPAGGAEKNRLARTTLSLPAGKYGVFFVTDGSHSPGHWNALPPRDPAFWGMTLRVRDPQARRFARLFDFRDLPGDDRVLLALTRMRDDDSSTRGIRVTAPTRVRIYAVGEGREDYGMVDFGWIADARTREKVWVMDFEGTEHAGGALKNRVADRVLELQPGSYLVGFVTDDSHSYRDWNAAPPTHPERWGLTLFAAGEDFDPAVISTYRADEDPAILARISQVRSDSHKREDFQLERRSRVSVYALGEGLSGEMYDYGWLEDAGTGRVVWKMTYPDTDGAGGAAKNRLYRGTLDLEAGRYTLHYRTDDSHAYRDWNDAPPADPEAWGVQVALVDPR